MLGARVPLVQAALTLPLTSNPNPTPTPNPSPSPKPSPTQAQHPHIVRLHGVVIDDPTSVSLLMGLSPIGSLRKLLDEVSFRVRVRLS